MKLNARKDEINSLLNNRAGEHPGFYLSSIAIVCSIVKW
nr:MAG TPA: hypothetical protein [Caudoviricetes sp.]